MASIKAKEAKQNQVKVKKQDNKFVASDPSSLQAVYAELEAANFNSKQEAALKAIFRTLAAE
jgi:hypothetical protein